PDPPPDVPALPPRAADATGNAKEPTMRQKMLDHRVRADCIQCHSMMDPIGFALEPFDGIALKRALDEGQRIDPASKVFDGTEISGPTGLRNWLVSKYSDQFVEVAAEKLLTYALGRRGAGMRLGLPLLDSMVPAATAFAQTVAAKRPQRFVGVFFPHGMAPGYWVPEKEGALGDKLPYILESLAPVRDQTTVISGLWSKSAEPPEGTTGSDHWVAAAYLTGIKPRKTAGSDATVGSP